MNSVLSMGAQRKLVCMEPEECAKNIITNGDINMELMGNVLLKGVIIMPPGIIYAKNI